MNFRGAGRLAIGLAPVVIVIGAYALLHGTVTTRNLKPRAVAEPIRDTSQLKALVAARCRDLHADGVLAPMTFTNNGRTCDLYGDVPRSRRWRDRSVRQSASKR